MKIINFNNKKKKTCLFYLFIFFFCFKSQIEKLLDLMIKNLFFSIFRKISFDYN